MTLRDEHGEVEVGIGDLFEVEGAKFSVICPELSGEPDSFRNVSVWVRLLSGKLDLADGRCVELKSPDGRGQPYLFEGALLAGLVRNHRLMTFNIAPPAETPARIDKKTPRAPTSKKPARKHEPTSESLFD
jgi:hypothetical protein